MTTETMTREYQKPFRYFPLGLIAGLIIWFVLIVTLTLTGAFDMSGASRPISMLLAVTLPPLFFLTAYRALNSVRSWVHTLDIRLLILPHSLRMIGMGFIFLYFYEKLPPLFAFPAGLGDALAAFGAVYLSGRFLLGLPVTNAAIARWNLFALIDFIVAVSMGVLTRSNGLLQFEGHPVSDPMGLFPLAIIPGFFVPFYICTHLMIMLKLRHKR